MENNNAGNTFQDTLERMRKIWCTNLGLPEVADDDNYFVIGGDSITGINLFAEIKKEFGAELEYTDMFDYQELKSLTERVSEIIGN